MKTDIGTGAGAGGVLLQIPGKCGSGFGTGQWVATRIFRSVVKKMPILPLKDYS